MEVTTTGDAGYSGPTTTTSMRPRTMSETMLAAQLALLGFSANAQKGVITAVQPIVRATERVGRNDPCPCGCGKKFKNCHGGR